MVGHTILERGLCLLHHCLVLLSGSRVFQVLEERVREVPGDDGGDDEARDDQDAQVEVVVASAGGARLGHQPRIRHLLTAVFHQFSSVQFNSIQCSAVQCGPGGGGDTAERVKWLRAGWEGGE